eukprot:588180-Prorocentrum_minimum.AAC.2
MASDWSVMRIHPYLLRPIGPYFVTVTGAGRPPLEGDLPAPGRDVRPGGVFQYQGPDRAERDVANGAHPADQLHRLQGVLAREGDRQNVPGAQGVLFVCLSVWFSKECSLEKAMDKMYQACVCLFVSWFALFVCNVGRYGGGYGESTVIA